MCFVAINARGRTSSNTNKQTNNTTKNKRNKTIYNKMATVCCKENLLFLKNVVFNKGKKYLLKCRFTAVASRQSEDCIAL